MSAEAADDRTLRAQLSEIAAELHGIRHPRSLRARQLREHAAALREQLYGRAQPDVDARKRRAS